MIHSLQRDNFGISKGHPEEASEGYQDLTNFCNADVKPEVLSSEEGVKVESASRMDYDRSKWMRASAEELVDPDKADAEFMRCLLQLLRKVRLQLPVAHARSPLQHAGLRHREVSRQRNAAEGIGPV